jgi:glutamate-1-semialdehyde 2,1-aminomutase
MSTGNDWEVTEWDRELFRRELESFIPDRIFDAHAHAYRLQDFAAGQAPAFVSAGPTEAGVTEVERRLQELIPGRPMEGLYFPYPHRSMNTAAANEYLGQELQQRPRSRGQLLITPEMSPQDIHDTIRRLGFVGLKCYHVYAARERTFEATIEEYLPEPQVQVADELGLSITLHIVRATALADAANQETIRRYCSRYPRMRLILAHAARGFNPHHTLLGIDSLLDLDNVWFDTSAVTDCGAVEVIIRRLGHRRVLYGADFPVSHLRGRCVGLGDSFFWISPQNTQLQVPYADLQLAMVGHESLRMLKVAAMATGLTDSQVEDVFWGNAARLFGI